MQEAPFDAALFVEKLGIDACGGRDFALVPVLLEHRNALCVLRGGWGWDSGVCE